MSSIFAALGIEDTDRSFVNVIGQSVVYEATQQVLADHNAELAAAYAIFVQEETEDFKQRYKLPGGGYLERRGGLAKSGAARAYGKWDVAYPLEDFGRNLAASDVALAYMTMQELDLHLDSIFIQNVNTVRHELLAALLNNTQGTFDDPVNGSLSIEPLANGDAVVYPPVLGSTTEAIEDHYLESGYLAANISDTNSPFPTIRDDLTHHFGISTGGEEIVAFINTAQRAKVEDLIDFNEVPASAVRPGAQTAVPTGWPQVPGRVLGHCSGCWVAEWPWIPADYIVAVYVTAPAPLKMRVDPADTGLPRGLSLIVEDETYPLQYSRYRHRFGFGAGNRLNGVVMELGTGGTYTVPTGY